MSEIVAAMSNGKSLIQAVKAGYDVATEARAILALRAFAAEAGETEASATRAIADMAASPQQAQVLRKVVREILFGTETIALAALAKLAARLKKDPSDFAAASAAYSVDGLANSNALLFLMLLSAGENAMERLEEPPLWRLDIARNFTAEFESGLSLIGLRQRAVLLTTALNLRRAGLLAEPGRVGLMDAQHTEVFFLVSAETHYLYSLLWAAAQVAERDVFMGMPWLLNPDDAADQTPARPL
jgi:hypothetical protein